MFRSLAIGLTLIAFSTPAIPLPTQRPGGLAARIVLIRPKDGMQKQFEEGYKRHLEWRRRNQDHWTWYGWQVITGTHVGYFMDGTFGHRWEDFDRPVAPAEDAADNVQNVSPYGDFLSVSQYVLRPELSHGHLLEEQTPSPSIELLHFQIHLGKESDFEEILRKVHAATVKGNSPRRHTWYQLVNGGEQSTYILMLPHDKFSELQSSSKPLTSMLEGAYPPAETKRLSNLLSAAVREVRSETLRYRTDMSYFPVQR